MSIRSILAVVMLLIGVSSATAEDRATAEARWLLPVPFRAWTAGPATVERQPAVGGMQNVIVKRTYTTADKKDQLTIMVQTFDPITSAFILGATDHNGATDPVARAGLRPFEFERYRGIASGPEESPDSVRFALPGGCVLSLVRQRGASDAIARYLYAIDFDKIKQFAAREQNALVAGL